MSLFSGKLSSIRGKRQKAFKRVNSLVSQLEKAQKEAEQAEKEAIELKNSAEVEIQEARSTQETVEKILGEVNE